MSSHNCVLNNIRVSTRKALGDNNVHVQICAAKLKQEIQSNLELYSTKKLPPSWAQDYHYSDGTDLTAQYIFVLDALNFCFWPYEGYEYHNLAGNLKRTLEKNKQAFDAEALAKLTEKELNSWLQNPKRDEAQEDQPIPLLAERTRLVNEVGIALMRDYDGKAANMVRAAKRSGERLVALVTAAFPGFRDHCVSADGSQVFFYKRAQILVGDLWGAYGRKGLGEFSDIHRLTCFADYRLPQLMFHIGILRFSESLEKKVLSKEQIMAGSQEEIAIRAATVQCVELMVKEINEQGKQSKGVEGSEEIYPVQLDWLLWERGESLLKQLPPHHRVLTVYY